MEAITRVQTPADRFPAGGYANSALLKHFAQAALDVLQTELGLEAWRGEVCPACPSEAPDEVRLMLFCSGASLRGVTLLAMNDETLTAIAAHLDEQAAWTSRYPIQRGMSRFGTALARGLNRHFAQAGLGIKLSPPITPVGQEAFHSRLNLEHWRLLLHTALGDIQLYMAWRETATPAVAAGH